MHAEEILWWSHGGVLHGESQKRIQFLRDIYEKDGFGPVEPCYKKMGIFDMWWDVTCGGKVDKDFIMYFGIGQPTFRTFELDKNIAYKIDIIDTWEMTVKQLEGTYSGQFRIELPGKSYIAIRLKRMNESERN